MSGQPRGTQEPRRVLVKVKRYDGSESVLRRHDDPELAQAQADAYNEAFQIDTCYVEDYDPAKDEWPTAPTMEEALTYVYSLADSLRAQEASR